MVHKTSEILQLLNGSISGSFPEEFPLNILTDSRKKHFAKNALFVALTGPNFNGHNFLNEVYSKGVKYYLVSEKSKIPTGANAIVVEDTLKALQSIAAYHRSKFDIPVVAITGSNGKTIVKDWLSDLLSPGLRVLKSPKSYNSQLGVALSLLNIRDYHQIAIIEAGISKSGEMSRLEAMIRPSFGILTHMGSAHEEGFDSSDHKLKEKLSLFKNTKELLFRSDTAIPKQLLKEYTSNFKDLKLIDWSNEKEGMFQVQWTISEDKATINIIKPSLGSISIPYSDPNSLENATTALIASHQLGYGIEAFEKSGSSLSRPNMRLEQLEGINGCQIINDGYSLDMSSLGIALDFLIRQSDSQTRTVIISSLPNSPNSLEDYQEMAGLLQDANVNKVIAIGEEIKANESAFSDFNTSFFSDSKNFLSHFDKSSLKNESILVKGARKFELDKIASGLQEKVHSTRVEINLNLLSENLDYIKSKLNEGVKLMAMVKASSYGSGTHEIANLLEYKKLDYLCVAFPDEGISLRKAGVSIPIMVLNTDSYNLKQCVENGLEPVIYDQELLKELSNIQSDTAIPIHLEYDSGMKRLGYSNEQWDELLQTIQNLRNIRVVSIFSHLAAADEPSQDSFTREQINSFDEHYKSLIQALDYSPLKHICNTAGILRFQEAHFSMVRIGIGMYGINPTPEPHNLSCALSLKTVVGQIREVQKDETVGYSRSFTADKKMKIAVLPIGYADGLRRGLSNGRGSVYLDGAKAKIVGKICMDMCMVDVTDIKCKVGDSVVVFENNDQIEELANAVDTIPYEILTGISSRVKRVFTEA
jgi:alanine racemase